MNFFFVLYKLDVIFFLIGRWFGSIVCLVGWKLIRRKKSRYWVEWYKIGFIYNNFLLWEWKDVNMYVYIFFVEL